MNEFERLETNFSWRIQEHANLTGDIWFSKKPSTEDLSYPDDGHAHLQQLEAGSFWFEHRNEVIHSALKGLLGADSCLWEVGAGNGFVAQHLQKTLCPVVALEPGRVGAKNCLSHGIRDVVCSLFEDLQLPNGSLQAIGCFDVMEHLEKPELLAKDFYRTLQPGGILVVTVPALPFLWSDSDKKAGHFRRYTLSSCRELMVHAGFQIVQLQYFMSVLVPGVFLGRTLPTWFGKTLSEDRLGAQLSPPAESMGTKTARMLLQAEMTLRRYLSLPFGTSVLGVFRKKL